MISVVEDARLEPEAVGEHIDWRAATEAELSMGFARGDEACLQEVFGRLSPLIYTIAYRALDNSSDGEEITQEVFVSAWRARDNYQAEKGSLSGWLIGITRHRIADRQRARGRDLRLVQAVTNTTDVEVQPETLSTFGRSHRADRGDWPTPPSTWQHPPARLLGRTQLPADR